MNEFMKILLSLSVSGTLLLVLILGLKPLYKNKFSRRWQYYIWIIVVLRFLLPFTPNTMNVGSLFKLFHTTIMTNESPVNSNRPATVNTNDNETKQAQASEKEIVATAATQNALNIYVYLFFVWSALALVLFVRKITIYQGFIQYIKAGNIEVSDIKTLNLLSDCEEKLNIKTRIELYHNALIASPIIIGFFRPSIVLPVGELEDKELFHIFVHELLHYKQRDMFYKWLIQIVICIHWFNPFVYLLGKEVNKACELSCDEIAISILDDKTRREYGDTLIYFLKRNSFYKSSLASITLTEGAEQLKERLGAIMNFKKKTKTVRFLTGILTFCIIFGAAFVGVSPVSAATHSNSAETSKSPILEEKKRKTGTYLFDEDLNFGWDWWDEGWSDDWEDEDWDDEDWNDWKDEDWDDWKDEDWDFDWDWDDKELTEAYAAYGIKKDGKSYYYQGELVNIIKDQRPDSSFYMLDTNSKGTTSIKVIRNTEGKITGVSYMTEEEVAELLPKLLNTGEETLLINTREWDSSALLTIEAYYGTDSVFILPSPTNKIILKEYLTEDKSNYYASTEIKNNILTIRSGDRPTTNYASYIEIYVPNAALDHVKVETVSGGITIDHYTGIVALSTTGGWIDISDSNIAGTVNTVSGEIDLSSSDVLGDLYVHSHSGEIAAILHTDWICSKYIAV